MSQFMRDKTKVQSIRRSYAAYLLLIPQTFFEFIFACNLLILLGYQYALRSPTLCLSQRDVCVCQYVCVCAIYLCVCFCVCCACVLNLNALRRVFLCLRGVGGDLLLDSFRLNALQECVRVRVCVCECVCLSAHCTGHKQWPLKASYNNKWLPN